MKLYQLLAMELQSLDCLSDELLENPKMIRCRERRDYQKQKINRIIEEHVDLRTINSYLTFNTVEMAFQFASSRKLVFEIWGREKLSPIERGSSRSLCTWVVVTSSLIERLRFQVDGTKVQCIEDMSLKLVKNMLNIEVPNE
jgi:hypothetical protein